MPDAAIVAASEAFRWVLVGLEWFLPDVLAEIYPEWERQELDGVISLISRKTGERECTIFGMCIFMDDQTLAPLHIRLQIAALSEEISWLECRLGERSDRGIVRTPYRQLNSLEKRLYVIDEPVETINWFYKVTYGRRD